MNFFEEQDRATPWLDGAGTLRQNIEEPLVNGDPSGESKSGCRPVLHAGSWNVRVGTLLSSKGVAGPEPSVELFRTLGSAKTRGGIAQANADR